MTEQTSTRPGETLTVTGGSPIGYLPVDGGRHGGFGITIWECASCGSLINNPSLHESWHARQAVHPGGPTS
jgi:hypothetical protein